MSFTTTLVFTLTLLTIIATFLISSRLLTILPGLNPTPTHPLSPIVPRTPAHILIVLGSGGHTAEMFSMLRNLPTSRYTHRTYIVSAGDAFSASLAAGFESRLPLSSKSASTGQGNYTIHTIPRARQIHQSLLTTPYTSLKTFLAAIRILSSPPASPTTSPYSLILTNGPATALLFLLAHHFLVLISPLLPLMAPFFTLHATHKTIPGGRRAVKSIYIESWARVLRPSLTGRLVVALALCDRVLVQWRRLEEEGWGEYIGVLVA